MISIIIPTLNEEEGIAKVICSIPKEIRDNAEVIVPDVSTDLTPVIAQRLGAKVIRCRKRGKGYQMREAVKASKGDVLVFLDGDGTDPAQFIPKLLKKLEEAELVLACRSADVVEGDDPSMRQLFRFYYVVAAPISNALKISVSDPLAGFRAIRRKDWDKLNLKSNDFEIETEMNIRAVEHNFRIGEIRIPKLHRAGGLQGSKFMKSPKMWLKIAKMLLEYSRKNKNIKISR